MPGPAQQRASTVLSFVTWSLTAVLAAFLAACSSEAGRLVATAESCMRCHNGSLHDDYSGPGLENPHPFPGADDLVCTTCHGGNPAGETREGSHVPPPPQIGDREFQSSNRTAYFNRLTLTGIDKLADYEVDGVAYTALDYLQFVNPGDLRVVSQDRSCGTCHAEHAECLSGSLLATSAGILSGAMYAAGVANEVPESEGLYQATAADKGFRAVEDTSFDPLAAQLGEVARLIEFPVFSVRGAEGTDQLFQNELYSAAGLADDQNADGSVISGSPLANLYHEQVAFTCGDCHLGSAGANNRYGDFRSSGCTACHMPYSLDGRSRSGDPNVPRDEPLDPDDIDEPERSHVRRHMILSTARSLPSGEVLPGIDDYACAGCHQGSNRTVMQYWGIRLDQNQDVKRHDQYPANPVSFVGTHDDPRLFDPEVGNKTFNGRNGNQYLLEEDYDGDGRDDTPPDVHYEAGLGCIDCHGSVELHGGDVSDPHGKAIASRMSQAVGIRCESCHGSATAYAQTATGTAFDGSQAELAIDSAGNPLKHVLREADGNYYLYSKLTGVKHYVVQTRDVVVDGGKTDPFTGDAVYSALASYAMGRDDGNPSTGIGPAQSGSGPTGFAHADNMSCASCHASWTNNCVGCHLEGEYDGGNNFSNITGERIVFREREAQFVYQNPILFQLGIGADDKIEPISPNTKVFFRYRDRDDERSEVFAFSDRKGAGNNPAIADFPSLGHNVMMPHSIRGKVTDANEGPRYCVACHLTESGMASFGAEYAQLRAAMQSPTLDGLDQDLFELLKQHIGQNPGNQLDSPLWVHMVAGLGTGLFLFDEDGGAVNPLDENDDRYGSDGVAPAEDFDLARARYSLDRIVNESGVATGSSNHPLSSGDATTQRDGALEPLFSGPLGATLIQRLTDPSTGIVLDSWIDADGELGGAAGSSIEPPE